MEQYLECKRSVADIAEELDCSQNKVNYWLSKHQISKRSISEAIYQKANPDGDPFKPKKLQSHEEWFLYGLGLGLYWGEGTKSNQHAVRLGNTDPGLVKAFLSFLKEIYNIETTKLQFGVQIFNDIDPEESLVYWMKMLHVNRSQFYKPTISPSQSAGTYKKKAKYGVLTIYFHNKKLRDIIVGAIDDLRVDCPGSSVG